MVNLIIKDRGCRRVRDRNCIKVVCDLNLNALYFSREPIPTRCKVENIPMGKQVCIIPFRRDFAWVPAPTPLEIAGRWI